MKLTLHWLTNEYAVCRFSITDSIPTWAFQGELSTVTRTPDEFSVVCERKRVPNTIKQEGPWRAFRVKGTLDFAETGILASMTNPLAQAQISIFALSTFDTDYILVKAEQMEATTRILTEKGFTFE